MTKDNNFSGTGKSFLQVVKEATEALGKGPYDDEETMKTGSYEENY